MKSEHLYVHVPFRRLEEIFPLLLKDRLQPEIAFQGSDLDNISPSFLDESRESLRRLGLSCTVHAPFHDLNPGALEPLVREATLRRCMQTLEAAHRLGARLIVFHPGYEFWKYGGQDHLWLEQSLTFWPPLIERASEYGIVLTLENVFERCPEPLATLLRQLPDPAFGHCLDIGHWHLFSRTTPLHEWFHLLGSRLFHLHLHDNFGSRDDHLPVGDGSIDYSPLLELIGTLATPPTMTLEAHDPESLYRSLLAVRALFSGR